MKTFLRDIVITIVMAIVIFFLLQATVQSYVVVYNCMEPNFQEGDRLLVNKVVYYFHQPERGDVVILHPPFDPKLTYIKRVIALPGDTVEVKMSAVYVNGAKLYEPYIKEPPTYTLNQKKIPDGQYFVLGDNRNSAYDSYEWGTLPRQNIIGKAWLIVWPLDKWGLVPQYSFNN